MSFLDELRHRTIWQLVIVYAGASWVLLPMVDTARAALARLGPMDQ